MDLSDLSDYKKTQITELAIEFTLGVNELLYNIDLDVDLQCESPGYLKYASTPEGRHHNTYYEDNEAYDIVVDGTLKETYNIWLASNKTLGFRAYPTMGDDRDRVELILSSIHAKDALKFGDVKTLSYDLTIPGGEDSIDWLIFTQVWQQDCDKYVPFTIWFKPNSLDYELCARVMGETIRFGEGTLQRGVTTTFEYEFYPAVDGHIKVKIGDNYHEFNGIWGVETSGPFEIRVGIYRKNQMVDTVLCFDNIKLSTIK